MPNDSTDKSAIVSQKITQKIQDVSPAFILKEGVEWKLKGHKTETRDDVEINTLEPTIQGPYVLLKVQYKTPGSRQALIHWFAKRDIHRKNEQKLLLYWEKQGGRQNDVELPSDTVHLLQIIGEKDVKKDEGYGTKKYFMQFVGCPESEAQWWRASIVKEAYIELYE
ncbi:uncharacterized protein FSUBG_7538 [Fusarium subglutinans]|uniref:Chromo domain-containing protein n=1 Tax=Gibberella subglutinans TaxID=42677 RepID=A0A8H5UYI5_GIBSU|nr:uncharacterized protein FSUBG_7538 [Fusarium subglutinans]KAF5602898.1 hypothetical protein FSUBG_7538 [Fusarium subglutinans]